MLGYVKAFKPEMKLGDYELYRGIYCSLCRSLGRLYSPLAQIFLSYDFALAAVLRLAASESGCTFTKKRCPYNPAKKCLGCSAKDEIDFCAHAVIITVYYKLLDNLHDSGFKSKLLAAFLFPLVWLMHKKAKKCAPVIEKTVEQMMQRQKSIEAKPSVCIDEAADPSSKALGEIICHGFEGKKRELMYTIGYMTGRYVYILDAADDLEDDIKNSNFNPFLSANISSPDARKEFSEKVIGMLNLTQANALEALDALELKRFFNISDNILCDGLTNSAKSVLAKYETEKIKETVITVE